MNRKAFNGTRMNYTVTEYPMIDNDIYLREIRLMLLGFVFLTGFLLNLSLLLLFITRQKFPVKSNYLLANLTLSNLFACFFIVLPIIVGLVKTDQTIIGRDPLPCKIVEAVTDIWWVSQNITILLISYDRLMNILYPYKLRPETCKNMIGVWVGTFVIVGVLFTPWIDCKYDPTHLICRKDWGSSFSYSIMYTILTFWFPFLALFYTHLYMLKEAYWKKKVDNVLSGKINEADRTIISDRQVATLRSNSSNLDVKTVSKGQQSQLHQSSRKQSLNVTGSTSSSDLPSCLFSSQTGSIYDYSGLRKSSLQAKSIRKSINTIILLFSSYLLAALPYLIIVYFYMTGIEVSKKIQNLEVTRYTIILSLPYVFGPHSKVIKGELRLMFHRMQCWNSRKISPSPNIDENDYTENVIRRDSRRNSLVNGVGINASRNSSLGEKFGDDIGHYTNVSIPVISNINTNIKGRQISNTGIIPKNIVSFSTNLRRQLSLKTQDNGLNNTLCASPAIIPVVSKLNGQYFTNKLNSTHHNKDKNNIPVTSTMTLYKFLDNNNTHYIDHGPRTIDSPKMCIFAAEGQTKMTESLTPVG